MTDFAAIIGRRLEDEIQGEPVVDIYTPTGLGVYVLAARWPDGCPTCGGSGEVGTTTGGVVCRHGDAPTLGELLDTAAALHLLAREHGVTPAQLGAIGAEALALPPTYPAYVAAPADEP